MYMSSSMNADFKNALSELGNIGAGNAVTSLSVMLSENLTLTTPEVQLYDFNQLEGIFGGPEIPVLGVMSSIEGDLDALMLFAMKTDEASNLVKALMGEDVDWSSEIGISGLKEIANIMIASYTASLETLLNMKVRYTLPAITIDMAGAILSVPCITFGQVSDQALIINSGFEVKGKSIDGVMMLMSDEHSFDTILNKLGIGGIDG